MARKYGGRKRYGKSRSYKSYKKPWRYKRRNPGRQRKRKDNVTLENLLTNNTVTSLLLKTLAILALVLTVIGSLALIGWIWIRSGWSTGIRSLTILIVLAITSAILYAGYDFFLK